MKTIRPHSGGIMEKVIESIENAHYYFTHILRKRPQDYFEIETIQSDTLAEFTNQNKGMDIEPESYTLVAKDGSLLTVLEFDGVRTVMNRESIRERLNMLDNSIVNSTLGKAGYTFEFFFTMSPDGGTDLVRNLTNKSRETIKKFELNFNDVMDSRVAYLPKFIHAEKCYLGIWTHPSAINRIELDAAIEQKMEELRTSQMPRYKIKDRNGQYPYGGLDLLVNNHNGLIKTLVEDLNKTLGFKVKKITAYEALRVTKTMLYGGEVPEDWKPVIFGDELPTPLREQKFKGKQGSLLLDPSDLVYPPLSTQVLDSDIYTPKDNPQQVIIGNRVFSTVSVDIPPKTTPFNQLLSKLVDAQVPFNFRVVIKSDGMAYKGLKSTLANALNFVPPNNKRIKEAMDWLRVISERETVLRYSMSFSTFAPVGEERLLRQRQSQLKHILSSWGNCQPKDSFGDSVDAFFDTVPFISPHNGREINYHLAPMYSVFKMMPIFRPASVFENGPILYRSEDGKIVPFELCSPKQTTWAYYNMAIPGSGKSVDLAMKILGSLIQSGLERLPYVSSIDIGLSQSYLIKMIQSAYPEYLKHLAISERITMEARHAVNMFDTDLGCEKPNETHRETLINFICEVLTPPSAAKIDINFPSLITAAVDRVYKMFSLEHRDGRPKVYTENTDPEVDEAVRKYKIPFTRGRTSWHQIRNDLFDLGHIYEAEKAHRYAMPVLSDLVTVVQLPEFMDTYGKINADDNTGENLIDKFIRLIGIAQMNYPNIFLPTAIDFSAARIVSVDLDLVTKGEGDTGRKQQNIMYMLFKYAISKRFRADLEIVKTYPERYQAYHEAIAKEMLITNKILSVDEYHRTKNSPYVQNDFIRDAREGRKWKLAIILSSQQGDDISDELRKFLTGIFILRANGRENAKELQNRFGFGNAELEALLEKCHGPTEKGAPFLAILQTEEGTTSQLLYSTISPVEVWALTTTAEDVRIRNELSRRLGDVEARGRLARAYNFSAKYMINDLRNANLKGRNDPNFDPIQQIIKNIMESSPIYSNNEGAIFDAGQEVHRYYEEQDEIKHQKRLKELEEDRVRRSEDEQAVINASAFKTYESQTENNPTQQQ